MYDIAVVGVGNMGVSVLGAFLSKGKSCVAIDIDESKIAELKKGRSVVPEAGAEDIFSSAVKKGQLEASTRIEDVSKATAVFVGVQTPAKEDSCDYTALITVMKLLAQHSPQGQAVIIGSTIFPGGVKEQLLDTISKRPDLHLVYEPVFLRAGFGIDDYINPGKFIFGVKDPANPPAILNDLFCAVVTAPAKYVTWQDAEWIKMVHNAWMGVKITFANEMDVLCRSYDADTEKVFDICFNETAKGRLMTLSHMLPGPPYSGPCLPKDAIILGGIVKERGSAWMKQVGTLEALRVSNERYTETLVDRWMWVGQAAGKPLGIAGLSFRPGFNEMRFSLALPFIRRALGEGRQVLGYDPEFEGIGKDDFLLACRQDKELEGYHHLVTHSLEDVWKTCGVVFVNRKFTPKEKKIIDSLGSGPAIIDIYGSGIECC